MQVSTAAIYDRSIGFMSRLTQTADRLQTQIGTGKRLTQASDDAVAFQRVATLKRAGANENAYGANIAIAQSLLDASDDALGAVAVQLQRAQELALRAANGVLTDEDRVDLAAEIDAIGETMVSLANTRGFNGQPLFGGVSGDDAVVRNADGSVRIAEGGTAAVIPIDGSSSIVATESAVRVFGSAGGADTFATLQDLAAAMRTGDTDALNAGLEKLTGALDRVTEVRVSIGARSSRLEMEAERFEARALDREAERTGLEDTDVASAIAELQKTLTTLQATQASFSRLTQLSLFDYLR